MQTREAVVLKAERKLRESERRAEMAEELRQAAEAANRAKDEFLANVSHEFAPR